MIFDWTSCRWLGLSATGVRARAGPPENTEMRWVDLVANVTLLKPPPGFEPGSFRFGHDCTVHRAAGARMECIRERMQ